MWTLNLSKLSLAIVIGVRYSRAMFWLRTILFSAPLLLVFGGTWLFEKVSELQLSHETGALVCAIGAPVGFLDPLVPTAESKATVWERLGAFPAAWGIAVVGVSILLFSLGTLVEWLRLREVTS